jgi:hypothetical protein
MAMDIDMFDEYYGGDDYTRTIVYDHLSGTAHVLGGKSPKGDLGKSNPPKRETLTGFWGEILNDEVLNLEPVPPPPTPPEPPPSRFVGDRRKVPTYEEYRRSGGFFE